MIPAPGKHWFWYSSTKTHAFFEVWFSRTENTHERTGRRVESLTFRTLGRKRFFLQQFVDDVVKCHLKRQGVIVFVYVQRRLGLRGRVFATSARIRGFGTGRKGTHAA